MSKLSLIHISDIHLGAKLLFLGEKAVSHRERLWKSLEKAVETAISKNAQLFLITGDVFDTAYPSKANIERFTKTLSRLAQNHIYTVILPGNHDRLEPGSVWQEYQATADVQEFLAVLRSPIENDYQLKASNFKLKAYDDSGEIIKLHIPELDLCIWGRPCYQQRSTKSPIDGLSTLIQAEAEQANNTIVMAHGALDMGGSQTGTNIQEIKSLKANYVAFGDWHGNLEVHKEIPVTWYAGALDLLARDQAGAGQALSVAIDGTYTKVEQIPIALAQVTSKEYNLDQLGLAQLRAEISQLQNPEQALTVTITGNANPTEKLEISELQTQYESHFYCLNITDKTTLAGEINFARDLPEGSIPFEFNKLVEEQVSSGMDKVLAQQVLLLGLNTINNPDKR